MSRFWKQQRLFLQPISHQDLSILGASCCRRERFWLISGSAGSWRHRIHLSPLPPLLPITNFIKLFPDLLKMWSISSFSFVSPIWSRGICWYTSKLIRVTTFTPTSLHFLAADLTKSTWCRTTTRSKWSFSQKWCQALKTFVFCNDSCHFSFGFVSPLFKQ